MGFCYTNDGRLCCDICGAAGAKKYRCPFGYCQATAACPRCRRERDELFGRAAHREHGCERLHNEYQAQQDEREAMLGDGKALRCSALGDDSGRVHVLFRRHDGQCEGWYMSSETYRSIPLGDNATPDDYRQHGVLSPAADSFSGGRTTKQVVLL